MPFERWYSWGVWISLQTHVLKWEDVADYVCGFCLQDPNLELDEGILEMRIRAFLTPLPPPPPLKIQKYKKNDEEKELWS